MDEQQAAQDAQQAASEAGKPLANCSSGALSAQPDTTAQQTTSSPIGDAVSAATASLTSTGNCTMAGGAASITDTTSANDSPNAAGGASSAAQSMAGSAQGAAVGGAGEQGNVCASAAGAYTAVEAAALCGHALAGEVA